MTPFTRPPILVAVNIEPLVGVRIVGGFQGLETPAGNGNEELTQRVVTNDARHQMGLRPSGQPRARHCGGTVRPAQDRILLLDRER